jgi:hypothetical protein
MPQKVFVHITNRTIRIRPNAENVAAGEVLIGTIDHTDAGTDDLIGHKGSHVIYQHVEQLMNKAKLYDHHLYKIMAGKYVTGVNAGNDFAVTVAAGPNKTKQLAPVVLPTDTTESKAVTYVSSDPTKATVNGAGLVTGVAVGTTTITVTASGTTDTVLVTVTAN